MTESTCFTPRQRWRVTVVMRQTYQFELTADTEAQARECALARVLDDEGAYATFQQVDVESATPI